MNEEQAKFRDVILRLHIGEVQHISVTRDLADLGIETEYVAGKVSGFGRKYSASGASSVWVTLGNDTSAHPTIEWEESRYYTVKVL